jgi:hypothetical protein
VAFLGSFRYRIISSAHRDDLVSSFHICIPFIDFSCLIALAKNSSANLNNSGESGHLYLIPDFRENYCSFSPFSMTLAYLFMLRYVPSIPSFFGDFIMKGC